MKMEQQLPPRVNAVQARTIINGGKKKNTRLVDVRSIDELISGMIPGAKSVPLDTLLTRVTDEFPEPETPIILYCKTGMRSGMAQGALRKLGYTNVCNIVGGFDGWKKAGLPIHKAKANKKTGVITAGTNS
ncbi:MAG: rhodanese-like domain-containing protein [Planctomycetes bacterium]|nr:rhodanese-like domain-containing protein [Planctomycetota bacterium]